MSRTFAQIESGLPHSQKVRQLDHAGRWAYLCCHLTPLGGFLGMHRYPLAVWADDADVSPQDMRAAIARMIDIGLIEYEGDTVRIIGWFLKKNAPENASRMASLAADFADIDAPEHMLIASAAEFAVGSVKRAQRWKADSPEWVKMRDVFKPFLSIMRTNFEDDFHEAIAVQLEGQNRAVRAEIVALMPSLQFYLERPTGHPADTVWAPCPHPAHTVAAHETTRHDTDITSTEHLHEIYTAQNSGENVKPFAPSHGADVGLAEKAKAKGPRPETIAAAKRMATR